MPAKKKFYFGLLVEAALACSHYRVVQKLYPMRCTQRSEVANAATKALETLATFCRLNGRDARQSPLYESFGALASRYEKRYEFGRKVDCDDLSPRAIYDAIDKGNVLSWHGWTIKCSRDQELTDAYGQFAWGPVVTVMSPEGMSIDYEHPGEYRFQARRIYRDIVGQDFEGDDGLGEDPQHPFEHGYSEEYFQELSGTCF